MRSGGDGASSASSNDDGNGGVLRQRRMSVAAAFWCSAGYFEVSKEFVVEWGFEGCRHPEIQNALQRHVVDEGWGKASGRVLRGPGLARDVPGSHGIDQTLDQSGSASTCARHGCARLGVEDGCGAHRSAAGARWIGRGCDMGARPRECGALLGRTSEGSWAAAVRPVGIVSALCVFLNNSCRNLIN